MKSYKKRGCRSGESWGSGEARGAAGCWQTEIGEIAFANGMQRAAYRRILKVMLKSSRDWKQENPGGF